MSVLDRNPALARAARPLTIIVLAIGLSPLLLLAVFAFVGPQETKPQSELLLTWIAAAFALMQIPMSFVIASSITKGAASAIAAGKPAPNTLQASPWREASEADPVAARILWGHFSATIVRCALLEGAGLFAAITYFLEGHVISAVAAGLMSVLMLITLPTRSRLDHVIEDGLQLAKVR